MQKATTPLIQDSIIYYFRCSRSFFHHRNSTNWCWSLINSILISRNIQLCRLQVSQIFCNWYICSFKLSFIHENLFFNIVPGKLNYYWSTFLMCFIFVANVMQSIKMMIFCNPAHTAISMSSNLTSTVSGHLLQFRKNYTIYRPDWKNFDEEKFIFEFNTQDWGNILVLKKENVMSIKQLTIICCILTTYWNNMEI